MKLNVKNQKPELCTVNFSPSRVIGGVYIYITPMPDSRNIFCNLRLDGRTRTHSLESSFQTLPIWYYTHNHDVSI